MIPSHHCRAYRPTADLLTLVASFSGRCSNQELLSLSRRQSPQLLRPSRSTPISLLESAAAAPPAAPQPDPALSLQLDQRPHGPLLPYLAELSSFLENGYLRFPSYLRFLHRNRSMLPTEPHLCFLRNPLKITRSSPDPSLFHPGWPCPWLEPSPKVGRMCERHGNFFPPHSLSI